MRVCRSCCGGSTYTGQVQSCGSLGVPVTTTGTRVDFKVGSSIIQTVYTDASGNYSVTIANGTYTQVCTPDTVRLQTGTFTGLVLPGTIPTRTLVAASGYTCMALCALPPKNTLICHDAHQGNTFTMTWSPTISRWAGTNSIGTAMVLTLAGVFGFAAGGSGGTITALTRTSLACPTSLSITYVTSGGNGGIAYPDGSTFTITE